jgi:hypothetical protein
MLSSRQRILVSGRLSQPNGNPLVGVIVKAFDKDLPSRQPNEKELGQVTTDAEGRYEIAYTAAQLSRNEKGSADLIVRVFNQKGTQLAESPIHFNAPAETTVDLVVTSQEAQRSESEQILAKINPILDGVKFANVTDEDITFLVGATGIERERIEFLRKAAQLAQETDLPTTPQIDLPTVVFYGLVRQNLPLNPLTQMFQQLQLHSGVSPTLRQKLRPIPTTPSLAAQLVEHISQLHPTELLAP